MRHLGAALIGAALLFVLVCSLPGAFPALTGAAGARAASPQPSSGAGDTRSAGEAPGFVGSPVVAVGAVLCLGVLAAVATIGYVRLTGGAGRAGDDPAATHR